jgi:multidrug efflux pump subunit AcrB
MLVGIVKKNAIMMIDFALDAERNSTASRRKMPSTTARWCASGPS